MRIIQLSTERVAIEQLDEVVEILSLGGVVVFPTDALYALVANALSERAVRRVFQIKERDYSRPLPIAVRNMFWAQELVHINARNEEILKKVWPGKVTAILPKKTFIPTAVSVNLKNVGVRVPDSQLLDKLLERFGYPITLTSANISGQASTQKIDEIIALFSKRTFRPDIIVDVGTLPDSSPSTLLDLTGDTPKVLRVGAAKPDELMKLLHLNFL